MVIPESAFFKAEILVVPTWECNLRCSYCFIKYSDLARVREFMTPELAIRLIDALDEGLVHVDHICVHLYGGEPLLNLPAIEAMVDRVGEKESGRFSFAITTNGTCLSQRVIDLLNAGRFNVVLSIDGPPEIHDECRRTVYGTPTHSIVVEFLQSLRNKTRCNVRGSAVVRRGWSLSEATGYLHTLPINSIKAQMVRAPPGTSFALTETERKTYLADLEAIGREVIAELEAGSVPLDDRYSSKVLQLLKGDRRDAFCGAGILSYGITPSGDVLPCILMDPEKQKLGTLDENPEKWIQAGLQWRKTRILRSECKICSVLHICGGGCPVMMPICDSFECDIMHKNCEIATTIFKHFRSNPEKLLTMAGVS